MCVSISEAEFKGTSIYIGEKTIYGTNYHVLGYQNEVVNNSDQPNAMILHFPSRVPMTQENILDTENCPNIFKDMQRAATPVTRGGFSQPANANVQIFDSGIYTIVLANDANLIPEALNQIPEHKRPPLNLEIFDFYATHRSGFQIALCCFNNKDAKKAAPMFWYYIPTVPTLFILPGLDAHDGGLPKQEKIKRDHKLYFGSDLFDNFVGDFIDYSDKIPAKTKQFLPDRIISKNIYDYTDNGDFCEHANDIRKGVLNKNEIWISRFDGLHLIR
jgi:hypothetical protein